MRFFSTTIAAYIILSSTYCHRTSVHAECLTRLPVPSSFSLSSRLSTTLRIVNGIRAPASFSRNVVTIAYDTDRVDTDTGRQTDEADEDVTSTSRDYTCMGTLISPRWVLTAAHCFISPSRNYVLHGMDGHSLAGRERRISRVITHPKWDEQSSSELNDIQLIELEPSSSLNLSQPWQYMHINSNTSFSYSKQQVPYLRVKGFGVLELPENNDVPIQGLARQLAYADLPLAECSAGNSSQMLCTRSEDGCGPCYGDVGAPLYTVDKSAQIDVQLGILQLRPYAATNYSVCLSTVPSSSDQNVLDTLYTPLAPFVSWISLYVLDVRLISVPRNGLSSTNFSAFYNESAPPNPENPNFEVNVIMAVSIVGAVTLILLAIAVYLVIRGCIRRSKRREIEEYAENSFINPGGRFGERNKDPFAAIPSNTGHVSLPRTTVTVPTDTLWQRILHIFGTTETDGSVDRRMRADQSLDSKDTNSVSTISWGFGRNEAGIVNGVGNPVARGRVQPVRNEHLIQEDLIVNEVETDDASVRNNPEDPPSWLHAAWERLFRPLSPTSSNVDQNVNVRPNGDSNGAGTVVQFELEQPFRPLAPSPDDFGYDHLEPNPDGVDTVNPNIPPTPAVDCLVEYEVEQPQVGRSRHY